MKKNLWRIAKPLILLLAVVGLLLPALPARAESIQFDGTTVSFWLPPGYNKLYQTMEHEGTWGEKTVTWKDYDYHGTRVVQTVTFPDGSQDGRTGDEIDGVGFGGGVLFIRGDTDIRIEAEKYQKPYVEGVIYKEGAITVPGDGVSYPGYYYLSSRTEKEEPPWEWVYTKHNVALRIALTQTEPLYTLWLHFWTWGPADFTDSKGVRYTFKLDGKPVKDTHREYLNRILSSVTISGWKAPTPAPVTEPMPTPVAEATPLPTAVPAPPGRIATMVQPLIQLAEESPHPQLLEANYSASLSALRRNLENLEWAERQHEYYQKQPTQSWLEAQARGYNVAFWRQVISNLVKTMYQQLNTLEGFLDSARSIGAPVDYELDSQWQEARGTLDIARARYDIGTPAPELEEVPVELEEVPVKLEQILVELEEVPVQASFLSQRHNSLVAAITRLREDRVQLYQSQQELLPTFTEQAKVARDQSQRLTTEYERWGKEIEEDRTAFVGDLRDYAINKLIPGVSTTREVLARTEPPSLNLAEQLRWSTVGVMETCVAMAHEAEQLPPQQRIEKMASLLTTFISPVAPAVGVVSDVLSLLELALDTQKAFLNQNAIIRLDQAHLALETSLAYSEWNLKQLIETHDEIDESEEDLKVDLEEIDVELEELPVEPEEIDVELEELPVEMELRTEMMELHTETLRLHTELELLEWEMANQIAPRTCGPPRG